ncbi:MAG: hypothetical protein P8L83_01505 [Flavobacteriaceae bacterium]|nr:hypothetical protein [Flavobacteriaceae bacterium]
MNNYIKTILVMEEKVILLLNRLKENHLNLDRLIKNTEELKSNNELLKNKLITLEEQNKSLMITNNLLGSKENKTIAKRKINKLIKEVEGCIFQLSEIKNE